MDYPEVIYFLMLGFLLAHELDAVQQKEWQILPGLSMFDDNIGAHVFIWAHVPLFVLLLLFGGLNPDSVLAASLCVFAIIHVGLHYQFRNHPKNQFNSITSWAFILGAGLFGAAHLLLRFLPGWNA